MTAAQNNSAPAATGAENGGETVSTNIIGRWARRVKTWALARLHPARVEGLELAAHCPVCKRTITTDTSWIVWDGHLWHVECLARRRGWNMSAADPADTLPNRSVNRYQPDAREPGYEPPAVIN